MGVDREPGPPVDRHPHHVLAGQLTCEPDPTAAADLPALLDLITARETATAATAQQLRDQITTLTAQLSAAETELADLATTRRTLLTLTGTTGPTPSPTTEPTQPATATTPATLTDPTVARATYQEILAVFATATTALRAKDVCRALNISAIPKHTEAIRPRLKRLVKRNILTEPAPGLFTPATNNSPKGT